MPEASTPLDADPPLLASGVEGLDDVLGGGFAPHRLVLLEGKPGTGKTTLALQFLMAGARLGETVLYVTLSESREELMGVARSHGWSLDGVHVNELLPGADALAPEEQVTLFHPSEVELGETTQNILQDVQRLQPARVVLDSLSELRLMAGSSLRYRRQILALKQFLAGRRCTLMLLDDLTSGDHDLQVQSIAHAALRLEQSQSDFGATRRRLQVLKYRGQAFREGFHDYKILRGGLRVFPRLVAAEHERRGPQAQLQSGLPMLDTLLGGGLERGTSTLLTGAPGTGKSSLAMQFAAAAAARGERSALFVFDESVGTLLMRADGLGLGLRRHVDAGLVQVRQVDPGELSPGELVQAIREAVEADGARLVLLDSLNGYLQAMPDERFLIVQLHELLTYLGHAGVVTLLVSAQGGLVGAPGATPVDASYLADAVLLLRNYEDEGELRQAISVVKKRGSAHERTIRGFTMGPGGLQLGEPLRHLRGVLTGAPQPVDGS